MNIRNGSVEPFNIDSQLRITKVFESIFCLRESLLNALDNPLHDLLAPLLFTTMIEGPFMCPKKMDNLQMFPFSSKLKMN